MDAAATARMDIYPFEAKTTIAVRIVSRLTGDPEINSPETLVAFAHGMSLFVIPSGLNFIAPTHDLTRCTGPGAEHGSG